MSMHDLEFDDVLPLLSTPAARARPPHARPPPVHPGRGCGGGSRGTSAGVGRPGRGGLCRGAERRHPRGGLPRRGQRRSQHGGADLRARPGHYERLRGGLAHSAASLRPLDDGWGFHPALGYLHRRYKLGQVAVIQGAGTPQADLSHFTATATTMRGGSGDGTGWLGRYLDGVTEAESGMRAMTVGPQIPLYLQGRRAKVTAIPRDGVDVGCRSGRLVVRTRSSMPSSRSAREPTGLGTWGDAVAELHSRRDRGGGHGAEGVHPGDHARRGCL